MRIAASQITNNSTDSSTACLTSKKTPTFRIRMTVISSSQWASGVVSVSMAWGRRRHNADVVNNIFSKQNVIIRNFSFWYLSFSYLLFQLHPCSVSPSILYVFFLFSVLDRQYFINNNDIWVYEYAYTYLRMLSTNVICPKPLFSKRLHDTESLEFITTRKPVCVLVVNSLSGQTIISKNQYSYFQSEIENTRDDNRPSSITIIFKNISPRVVHQSLLEIMKDNLNMKSYFKTRLGKPVLKNT